MDYTITLTDTEKKSMEYIAVDVDAWITNAATNRARLAKEEIIDKLKDELDYYENFNENDND